MKPAMIWIPTAASDIVGARSNGSGKSGPASQCACSSGLELVCADDCGVKAFKSTPSNPTRAPDARRSGWRVPASYRTRFSTHLSRVLTPQFRDLAQACQGCSARLLAPSLAHASFRRRTPFRIPVSDRPHAAIQHRRHHRETRRAGESGRDTAPTRRLPAFSAYPCAARCRERPSARSTGRGSGRGRRSWAHAAIW
jgi:hypothetical protein